MINAITHISDSGLNGCYYLMLFLWLCFGYFTSDVVQREHAMKPVGKQRLLSQKRLGGEFANEWTQSMCKPKQLRNQYLNNHLRWEAWLQIWMNRHAPQSLHLIAACMGPCKSKRRWEARRIMSNLPVTTSERWVFNAAFPELLQLCPRPYPDTSLSLRSEYRLCFT